jgi:hypothetical protein
VEPALSVLFVSEDFMQYPRTYGAVIKAQWCVENLIRHWGGGRCRATGRPLQAHERNSPLAIAAVGYREAIAGPSLGRDTGARHRAFRFWVAGATLIVAKLGEQFYTDAVDQRAHPS